MDTNTNKAVLLVGNCSKEFDRAVSYLKDDGFDVYFESDFRRALSFVDEQAVDLIVSEIAAPNVDGLLLCSRLKRISQGTIPIILVGDLSRESSIVNEGLASGATIYFQRPVDEAVLYNLCVSLAADRTTLVSPDQSIDILDSLIKDVSDIVTVVDGLNMSVVYQSKSASLTLGSRVGRPFAEVVHPDDVEQLLALLHSVYCSAEGTGTTDCRLQQNDGSWIAMEIIAREIHGRRTQASFVITAREKPESRAIPTEPFWRHDFLRRSLFDGSSVGLATLSASGQIVNANRALVQMLDHSIDELLGMTLSEFVVPYDPETDWLGLTAVLDGKQRHYRFQNGYIGKGGHYVWGDLTFCSVAGDDQESESFILIFDDPTGPKPKRILANLASQGPWTQATILDLTQLESDPPKGKRRIML